MVRNIYDFCSIWKFNITASVNYTFWLAEISNLIFIETICVMEIVYRKNVYDMTLYQVMFYLLIKYWKSFNIGPNGKMIIFFSLKLQTWLNGNCMLGIIGWSHFFLCIQDGHHPRTLFNIRYYENMTITFFLNEWVDDCCLMPNEHLFRCIMMRTNYIQWDDDVRFGLDQHAELDFYSASSLKQKSVGRHVTPLWHIILIPSQSLMMCA